MNTYIIEIHPKKAAFDPLARTVRSELIEAGESPEEAQVSTQRLFKITGPLTFEQAENVANTLLVDPIVETIAVNDPQAKPQKKKAAKGAANAAWVLDVWPKQGVTDPIGETIEKGLRDLGYQGVFQAHSAHRYVFPKIKSAEVLKKLAQQILANEMIHDITISREN